MKTLIILLLCRGIIPQAIAAPTPKDIQPDEHSTNGAIDDYAGLGEERDEEQTLFSLALLQRARANKQTVKIATWLWKGKAQFHAMVRNPDGSWSGPNVPMGYYTSRVTTQIIDYSKAK